MQSKNVPVFDKSVDYITLVGSQNERMLKLQESLEFESTSYLYHLESVIRSEKKMSKEIKSNEEKLLRKREDKLSRK